MLLVLFALFGRGGEAEKGTVVFEKFADQEEGIDCDDTIADQTSDVIRLGVFLAFQEDVVPQGSKLGIVLLELFEQFILTLANFFQRTVVSDFLLNG